MMNNMLNGMCRLSMSGGIAVKTSGGYKSYNLKTGRLTNCDSFVFGDTEEMFFVIPTNKAARGDIILVGGKPKCVIEAEKNKLTVINYEDSTIDTILPERHVIMGNTYFYGKIVSMFGNDFGKGKKGMNKIFSYMMMSEMMKGGGAASTNANSNPMAMFPMFMMFGNGGDGNFFDEMFGEGIFDMDDDEDDADESAGEPSFSKSSEPKESKVNE